MIQLKAIIVEDSRLARNELKELINSYPEIEVIAEAENVDDGFELINSLQPDLLFLDIHMPEKDGFKLLEMLDYVPLTIFTTAFDEYAIKSFEYNAFDYLLKPISEERFSKTIEKVKGELHRKAVLQTEVLPMHRKIFIKDGENCHFVPLSDIHYIESLDNYARLYFGDQKAMIKRSLNLLEEKLDPTVFFRANRSQIINIHYIQEIYPHFNNRLHITLTSGDKIEVSSRQSVKFKNWNSL